MDLIVSNEQERVAFSPEMEALLTRLLERALSEEGRGKEVEVSLVLTDDQGIQELNRTYRGKDRPTDVLSFAMEEKGEGEPDYTDPSGDMLGDIVISLETAQRQAEEFGHSLEREVGYLALHGMLHLLGYDHEEDEEGQSMREKEEKILAAEGLSR